MGEAVGWSGHCSVTHKGTAAARLGQCHQCHLGPTEYRSPQEEKIREKWSREGCDVKKRGQAKGTHILDLRKNVLTLGLSRVSTPPSGRHRAGFTALTKQTSVDGTGPDLTGNWDCLFFSCLFLKPGN